MRIIEVYSKEHSFMVLVIFAVADQDQQRDLVFGCHSSKYASNIQELLFEFEYRFEGFKVSENAFSYPFSFNAEEATRQIHPDGSNPVQLSAKRKL